jgi:alpha-L-fucosidase
MYNPEKDTVGNTDWFVKDRFGMFIHWGLYALPARHEWIRNREEITNEAYQKFFDHLIPIFMIPRPGRRLLKQRE